MDDIEFDDDIDIGSEVDTEEDGDLIDESDIDSESDSDEESVSGDEIEEQSVDDFSVLKKINLIPPKSQLNTIYKQVSRFEVAGLIGTRAEQIIRGAPIYVDVPENMTDAIEIAILEWRAKKIPLTLIRDFNGKGPGKFIEIEYSLDSLFTSDPVY
jgi:DNA-directed RNA polymerase subunit K/omega